MSRLLCAICTFVVGLSLANLVIADATKPPHMVLFIADDLTWHDIGPYGAKDVKTPNLDRFATQSLRFNQAFAASPTCTPSRSALFTGLYPFRNGAHANHSWISEGVRTMPQYLQALGYRVVIAGKTHIGPREQFPFEYLKDSNVMPPGKKEVLWTDLNTGVVDTLLAEHDKTKPLCLIVGSHSPHVYWPENDGTYDPGKINLPSYLVDTPETRQMRCQYYTDVTWMDKQFGEVMTSLEKHGFDPASTLTMFTADQGAQWPFSKWTLYDAGVRAPLLVRWSGKAKAGGTTDAMVSLIDLLPTMTEAAGGEAAAPKDLDGKSFLPVLLGKSDSHHAQVFASNTGDKQMNRSPARCVRTEKFKYILNLAPDKPFKTHISDAGDADGVFYWKSWEALAQTDAVARTLVERYRHRPAEELYDIQKDPFEQHNLAADPAYADDLTALRKAVQEWRKQQGENLNKVAMPEDSRAGKLPYAE